MDRPEVRKRVAIAYIVMGIALIAMILISQYINRRYAAQDTDTSVNDSATSETTPDADTNTEEAIPDGTYAPIPGSSCTYDVYQYSLLSDEAELAALGLPNGVTDDVKGGQFANTKDKFYLYAYPTYGCRAYLIANRDDGWSFAVLEGLTDNTNFQTADTMLPLYGIYAASNIATMQVNDAAMDAAQIEEFVALLAACENVGQKNAIDATATIHITNANGAPLTIAYHADLGMISVLGEYYSVTEEMKVFLESAIA